MVVYDNINMFDMAVECGAAINIENNQGLSPLTTAAYLARSESSLDKYLEDIWQIFGLHLNIFGKYLEDIMLPRMDMFFHIASIERDIYWQLGNVTCSAYPLK